MDVDERRPLLHSSSPVLVINAPCSATNDVDYRIIPDIRARTPTGRGRFFFVEIALMLFFLSDYPLGLVVQKYVVDWSTRELLKEYNTTTQNVTHDVLGPCDGNETSDSDFFQREIQRRSAMFSAVEAVGRGVPAVVALLALGTGSDLIGRRLAILPPMFGLLFYCATFATILKYQLSAWFLFVGEIVFGCCGSYSGMIMGCNAYIADTTPPDKMTIRLNVVTFCVLIPIIVSSETIGLCLQYLGYTGTVLAFLGISAANIVYVAVVLQEPAKLMVLPVIAEDGDIVILIKKRNFSERVVDQLRLTTTLFYSPNSDTIVNRNLKFYLLLGILVTINIAMADANFQVLFELNRPLCWSVKTIGIYSGLVVATYAVGALFVTRLQKCCMSDQMIAIVGLVATIATCVYKFFVTTTIMMFLGNIL